MYTHFLTELAKVRTRSNLEPYINSLLSTSLKGQFTKVGLGSNLTPACAQAAK
jgi:hypothetical protein